MKPRSIFPKVFRAMGIAIICGVVWFGYSMFRFFRAVEVGAEYPPAAHERGLSDQLHEQFGWSALPASSVERVWVNGFREHTSLFRIRLSPSGFSDLRSAVLATTGEGITSDDHDDLGLCPFGFATTEPRGPARMRLPTWWEAALLQHFDSVLWHSFDRGYWFAYDTDRQILFLLIYDT